MGSALRKSCRLNHPSGRAVKEDCLPHDAGSGESWFEPRRGNSKPLTREYAAGNEAMDGLLRADGHREVHVYANSSLKRETQIDSIRSQSAYSARSQSAYSAAIGTRQARTGSRPGRLSRMPGVLRSSRRPLHLRICLQSAKPALSTLAQGGDGVHSRRAVCREIASQRGHCK
jgi:hypothetical protein